MYLFLIFQVHERYICEMQQRRDNVERHIWPPTTWWIRTPWGSAWKVIIYSIIHYIHIKILSKSFFPKFPLNFKGLICAGNVLLPNNFKVSGFILNTTYIKYIIISVICLKDNKFPIDIYYSLILFFYKIHLSFSS